MKNILKLFLIFIIIISYCGCNKQQLPMPAYPLDISSVETALAKAGFPWTIQNKEDWGEGRIYFELNNEDQKRIAIISSVGDYNTRVLQLNFFSSTELDAPLPVEDWNKAVKLATILYGGFENENHVLNVFKKTYEETALIDQIPKAIPKNQERIRWNNEVNNVNCFIGLRRMDIDSNAPITELVTIYFTNKLESSTS